MKQKFIILYLLTLTLTVGVFAQTKPGKLLTGQVLLSNGWKLSPAGRSLPLGDLPLNMQLSASGKLLAVTNNGQSKQSLQLIDPRNEKVLDQQELKKSWYGIAFTNDEKTLYASGGNDNCILTFHVNNNKLGVPDTIKLGPVWPNKICPTGIAVNNTNTRLYTVTKEDSSLYVINPSDKSVLHKVKLPAEAYSCILSADGKTLYISLWGGDKVAFYNTVTQTLNFVKTGSHPNELLLNKKGSILFVANANDNSVSIISTINHKTLETVSTSLYPTRLTGSTTNGFALSANENTIYIANADNNCLAVFDVSAPGNSKSLGFIPVGWYPTNVKILNKKILVANGKGFTSLPNPQGPQPVKKVDNSGYQTGAINSRDQYIGGLFKGTLSIIDAPNETQLKAYTKQVYANTPFNNKNKVSENAEINNPIPRRKGQASPIKHVFYIIKENRTYDQVMGDVAAGNGDTSLCIFGKQVTPNHHAIANDFILMDNFYVDAEVSADGHNWSMAAYATDYTEKTWPTSYGGRGGTYDYEGTRKIASPRDGYIWDYCKRAGVSYRTYGEFVTDGEHSKASLKSLEGHYCKQSPGFDMNVKDVTRVAAWKHDFDSLLTINAVPQFNSIRISNDHTSGQKVGAYTPIACVADNDLAIGQFLEHLSKSSIWKESVVFILEDDAQNGPDHIDAHRSPVFVAGPYVKRNMVNHNMYSTSGVLRTIELILGLPPMSQYDAAAMPLYDCFTATPNLQPYTFKPAQVDLEKRNVAVNKSSERSAAFNLKEADAAPDLDLNEVVWKSVKGENAVMPAPKRSAFVILEKKKHDDD